MSVDVSELASVTSDVLIVGSSIFGIYVLVSNFEIIRELIITLIYGDPNDPSNYDFDNSSGKFDPDGKW